MALILGWRCTEDCENICAAGRGEDRKKAEQKCVLSQEQPDEKEETDKK